MAKKKKSSALTKITSRAKSIRRKSPGMSWRNAVKKAGAEYRGKKSAKPRKKSAPRKAAKKPRHKSAGKSHAGGRRKTAASHISSARTLLEGQLSGQLLRQYKATTKTRKRKLGKTIHMTKRKLRALKTI